MQHHCIGRNESTSVVYHTVHSNTGGSSSSSHCCNIFVAVFSHIPKKDVFTQSKATMKQTRQESSSSSGADGGKVVRRSLLVFFAVLAVGTLVGQIIMMNRSLTFHDMTEMLALQEQVPSMMAASVQQLLASSSSSSSSGSLLGDQLQLGHVPSVPLTKLVDTDNYSETCPPGLERFNDTILDPSLAYEGGRRRIPRIIHFTAKSRCLPPKLHSHLAMWKFANYSIFFHDDHAVQRLLTKHFPEFPHLTQMLPCIHSGAGVADLWRAVVLYEYGGIYTDVDNQPSAFNGNSIDKDDQTFFVVESLGVMSQYFMASEPKHPLMYLLVQRIMKQVMDVTNLKKHRPAQVTGPGALKNAMIEFMNKVNDQGDDKDVYETFQRVKEGVYTGMGNATVRVLGEKEKPNHWVHRDYLGRKQKNNLYDQMNMTHFSLKRDTGPIEGCVQRIYRDLVAPRRKRLATMPGLFDTSFHHENHPDKPLW